MSLDDKLRMLVEREAAEIIAAPVVLSAGHMQRCTFCGQLAAEGTELYGPAHSIESPQVRFKGICCGG